MTKRRIGWLHPRFRRQKSEHWKDMGELHEVMHRFPGYFKSLLLELLEGPMSQRELLESVRRMERGMGGRRLKNMEGKLDNNLALALDLGVLKEIDSKLGLTPGGREIAEHIQKVIPLFIGYVFSPQTSSIVTIGVHILFSILKFIFGFATQSAGLIADAIDNGMDAISAVLVWLGIRFDKERSASLVVVIMMLVSVVGIGVASYNKIVHPGPVKDGLTGLVVSALCGLVMLGISAYQYTVGKRSSNSAIVCQSVDSVNHFLTSMLVCAGIVLSFFAGAFGTEWLFHADAAASIIIGCLILRGAILLGIELVKPGGEPTQISHFMKRAFEKRKAKMTFDWLAEQLKEVPLSKEQLEQRFTEEFCEGAPKVLILSGMGYQPESSADLCWYLDELVSKKKLILVGEKYTLSGVPRGA